jgi:hypothetical protein
MVLPIAGAVGGLTAQGLLLLAVSGLGVEVCQSQMRVSLSGRLPILFK